MKLRSVFAILDKIIEIEKVGVLSTMDENNRPHMRWMTPTILHGREGFLYAVTSPKYAKIHQIAERDDVEWLFQNRTLNEIINVGGKMNLLDTPSAKSEVLEAIGPHLQIFWRVNREESDLVVLETVIRTISYFNPREGVRESFTLPGGAQ